MGPLAGTRIVEIAGIGPGPFCGMMLADMGAEVIRVEKPGSGPAPDPATDPLSRSRRSLGCDLKHPGAVDVILRLVEEADGLIEGFRPGVAERLGLGPDDCLARNPRLVYGRMTGWGQDGPLAQAAGHDINYIALTGALHMIGEPDGKPVPPLNLVGDFGGGGMLLAFGMVCALLEASKAGKGQVVDAAMVDGANALMSMFHAFRAAGLHSDEPGGHVLGGAAHFYDTYETKDGKFVAIGAIERQFYDLLVEKAGLDRDRFAQGVFRWNANTETRADWSDLKQELAAVIRTKTRDEWCDIMEGSDVCFAPVLTLSEAPDHPHNRARHAFTNVGGVNQPSPAPRFSRSTPDIPRAGVRPGSHSRAILEELGYTSAEIDALVGDGAVVEV